MNTCANTWTEMYEYMCKYMDRSVWIHVQIHEIHGQKCRISCANTGQKCTITRANTWKEMYKYMYMVICNYRNVQKNQFWKRMFDCRCFSKCITHITHCIVRQTYQPIFMLWELNAIDTSSTFHTIFQETKVYMGQIPQDGDFGLNVVLFWKK